MGYIRAEDVLPSEVLTLVQEFIDGQMLYVPKKDAGRNTWGSISGTKEYLEYRNTQICTEYRAGCSVHLLAEKYCLSVKAFSGSSELPDPLKQRKVIKDRRGRNEQGEQEKDI